MQIRSLTTADAKQIHRIWRDSLGEKWPISEGALLDALGVAIKERLAIGLWREANLLGIASAEIIKEPDAALTLLAVDSHHQHQGIGTQLIRELAKTLEIRGIRSISLGAGASKLLWHGVPTSLPIACKFFQGVGFIFEEINYDLIQDISKFTAPPGVFRCRETHGVEFETLNSKAITKMLAFEHEHFPEWHKYFEDAIAQNRLSDVIIAKRGEEILGTVLISVEPECPGGQWREFLGPNLGAIGIIGVAPAHRERGIGLALAAHVTQVLRDRGVRNCFIHWTSLRDWYGKLGYKVWEEYQMGKLALET